MESTKSERMDCIREAERSLPWSTAWRYWNIFLVLTWEVWVGGLVSSQRSLLRHWRKCVWVLVQVANRWLAYWRSNSWRGACHTPTHVAVYVCITFFCSWVLKYVMLSWIVKSKSQIISLFWCFEFNLSTTWRIIGWWQEINFRWSWWRMQEVRLRQMLKLYYSIPLQ
jgi:hypothetical protein